MLSDGEQTRLRRASHVLIEAGRGTAVLRAAVRSNAWNDGLCRRIVTDVWDARDTLRNVGFDPSFLTRPDALPAVPGHQKRSSGPEDDTRVQTTPVFSPQAVLDARAAAETPLPCDGSLDGLRGIPISDLDGIGTTQQQRLNAAGIETLWHLLMRVPLRYIDRRDIHALSDLVAGMTQTTTTARVVSVAADRAKRLAKLLVADGETRMMLWFFGAPWQAKRFTAGDTVLLQGDVTEWQGRPRMVSPLIEPLHGAVAPVVPVYPQSQKHQVSTWLLGKAATQALARLPEITDPIPTSLTDEIGLMNRNDAFRAAHLPSSVDDATAGRDRLAYDELLRMQLALGAQRHAQRATATVAHRATGTLTSALRESLPYPLTGAQDRASTEIIRDLTTNAPMTRLLQGDVGSGKTLVALLALLTALEGGHQAALMAPTEILATQHHAELQRLCEPLGISVELLTARARSNARRQALAALQNHEVSIVVGTHSLLSEEVEFASLGLVVIDEQHRFGVEQRSQLLGKGPRGATPDLLVATATPIPRTAAMTSFGDLDLSVLDELPPGRTPITTTWEADTDVSRHAYHSPPWALIHEQVAQGRQAYVVCPLVEDSEKAQAAAAEDTAEQLRHGALSELRIGVVTGKQRAAERTATMHEFSIGALDVLVATTVIEVGVNVPNATSIVIMDAPRFGLAQLHQLRGRVGRGTHPGYCVLTGNASESGAARMEAMCATTDGFALSETDLQLRGPGALTGRSQAGQRAGLYVADLIADVELMHTARGHARQLLHADPQLTRRPQLRAEVEMALGEDAEWLLKH